MNKKKSFLKFVPLLCLLIFFNLFFSAIASNYPEKDVKIVITWDAGGSTDVMGRIVAEELGNLFGVKFFVENRPGAGGEIGWVYLSNAKPDGYTIGNINIPYFINTYVQRDECSYRLSDFVPIANLVSDPAILAVKGDSSFETLGDFINYAKENPQVLTVSSEGVGSSDWLVMTKLEELAGIELNLINFEGDAPARTALLGGHISAYSGNLSEVSAFIETGQMRVLGLMSEDRSFLFPLIPTFKENGFDIVSETSRGFIAPKGFPDEYRQILVDALEEIVKRPDFIQRMEELGVPMHFISGSQFEKSLEKTERLIKEAWDKEPWL